MRPCPWCGADRTFALATRPVLKCGDCGRQFSAKVGTERERSKLPDGVWERAEALFGAGANARQVSLTLGIQYRTAWRLGRLIATAPNSIAGKRA